MIWCPIQLTLVNIECDFEHVIKTEIKVYFNSLLNDTKSTILFDQEGYNTFHCSLHVTEL